MKLVSSFRKCAEHLKFPTPSEEALKIKKSVEIIEAVALEKQKQEIKQDKGK